MKSKGTSVWEQYIEYVTLCIAMLVLLWFGWSAFTSNIEFDTRRQPPHVQLVSTSNVDEELMATARQIEPKLKDSSPSPIQFSELVSLLDDYNNHINRSVSPSSRVQFPSVDMTSEIDLNLQVQSELRMYVQPEINAPEEIRTQQWFGTITSSEFDRVEELDEVIEGPPHDTTWVSNCCKV